MMDMDMDMGRPSCTAAPLRKWIWVQQEQQPLYLLRDLSTTFL